MPVEQPPHDLSAYFYVRELMWQQANDRLFFWRGICDKYGCSVFVTNLYDNYVTVSLSLPSEAGVSPEDWRCFHTHMAAWLNFILCTPEASPESWRDYKTLQHAVDKAIVCRELALRKARCTCGDDDAESKCSECYTECE